MSSPRISHQRPFVIATAGLGLLAQTRLKAACGLLMADLLHTDIVPWGSASAGLLMTDVDTEAGRDAYAQASRASLPILALSRSTAAIPTLSSNTTVKDLAHELKLLIQSAHAERTPSAAVTPLLDKLRLSGDNDGRWLMELGLARVVIDLGTRRIHELRHVSLDDLLREAANPGWQATRLSEDEWLRHDPRHIGESHSIESFWWRLAAQPGLSDVGMPLDGASIQLSAWPELDPQFTDASLLMPLAYLMHGSWSAPDMVRMTGLSHAQANRLLGIVVASGLARRAPAAALPAATSAPSTLARSLLKAARRFGLLLGARHV